MHAQQSSLADVAGDVAIGAAGPERLHAALLTSRLYCERSRSLGFRALGPAGAGVVQVFTSRDQLALARGTVPWFSLTGADLLELLPAGYDLLLDPAGPAPLRLRPSALTRRVVLDVQRADHSDTRTGVPS